LDFKIGRCMALTTRIAGRLSIVFNQVRIGGSTETTLSAVTERPYPMRPYIIVVRNVK
jgi:hypothetical protein